MLAADRRALHSKLRQASLQIREKELLFFNKSFQNIATQSAVLTGFAAAAIAEIDFIADCTECESNYQVLFLSLQKNEYICLAINIISF